MVWALEQGGDLNANLVCFGTGGGVGEHVNDEVEVIIVGVSGTGFVRVDGEERPVSNGTMTLFQRAPGAPPGAHPKISPTSRFTAAGARYESAVEARRNAHPVDRRFWGRLRLRREEQTKVRRTHEAPSRAGAFRTTTTRVSSTRGASRGPRPEKRPNPRRRPGPFSSSGVRTPACTSARKRRSYSRCWRVTEGTSTNRPWWRCSSSTPASGGSPCSSATSSSVVAPGL